MTCASCGVTVARLFAPNEGPVPVDAFQEVVIGRPNGAPAVLVRCQFDIGGFDAAGIRIVVPERYACWATGTWVAKLTGGALTVIPTDPDPEDGSGDSEPEPVPAADPDPVPDGG